MEAVPSYSRRPNANRVKDKAPNTVQITSEQLLREALERKESATAIVPKVTIADHDELLEYQRNERKNFETRIVRNRSHVPLWIRYARWEEEQREFVRARSIWERAIDNDYRNPVIWLNYAEMEMRHRFVNHARNVFDRAVALLPRVEHIWLRYAHMEDMLSRPDLARNVYDRWLKWFPENTAYFAYIRFELRNSLPLNARRVYEQLVLAYPTAQSYIKFSKFEESQQNYAYARKIYERATDQLLPHQLTVGLFIAFAKFEERRRQIPRARTIYKFALAKFTTGDIVELERAYTSFEKQHGDRDTLELALVNKRRKAFKQKIASDNRDYDTWFDLLQLEEASSSPDQIRDAYERAISNTPESTTKAAWSRYIYLWLLFAAWTEVDCNDLAGALAIYKRCVATVPFQHRKFSFGKLWLQYAHAEIRNSDVKAARQVFGTSIGVLPAKHKLYQAYIEFECSLGEMERAREIYQVWLSRHPTHGSAFLSFADLELKLGEMERARAVMELATSVASLKDEQIIWTKLVSVTALIGDKNEAMDKFDGYLQDRSDKCVWSAYVDVMTALGAEVDEIRTVFERASHRLREQALSESTDSEAHVKRETVLEIMARWLAWEEEHQSEYVDVVRRRLPRRVEKNGSVQVVFANEQDSSSNRAIGNKLLEASRRWMSQKANV